jgi:enolase-phosphatase E1
MLRARVHPGGAGESGRDRVTISLRERGVAAVLLDVEGTTTPISFVYDVLFPYARSNMRAVLQEQADSAAFVEIACMLREERHAAVPDGGSLPLWQEDTSRELVASVASFCDWLMERDVKSPGLKLLQGIIWEKGYANSALRGEVFPDVPPALARWKDAGITIAIYSSGSVLAQKLIFAHTDHGDLTPYLGNYFDTAVGPKKSPASYETIASRLRIAAGSILFLSDVPAELTAAREASYQTLLCVRPGNAPVVPTDGLAVITTFDDLV